MYSKVINKPEISSKQIKILFFFLVFFIAELFIFTWVRTQCIETGYKISRLNAENKKITDLRDSLQVKKNQYKSPERIALIAEKYGGMIMPSQEQIILLE